MKRKVMEKVGLKIKKLFYHRPKECGVAFLLLILVANYQFFSFLDFNLDEYKPGLSEMESDLVLCKRAKEWTAQPPCDILPKKLSLPYRYTIKENVSDSDLSSIASELNIRQGGEWAPASCSGRHQVAIVVPLRGRREQLAAFLHYMHKFLQRQFLEYRIFVVEQEDNMHFNRGMLLNVGFVEAHKFGSYCCMIFSDVDLLPEDPRNMYACSNNPRHLSASVNTFRYVLPYKSLIGGVMSMIGQQFQLVNGFSNRFFGWGGEDDDFMNRLRLKGLKLTRWPKEVSRYTMLPHKKESPNPNRQELLRAGPMNVGTDGLSSLEYKMLRMDEFPLYTRFLVNLEPVSKKLFEERK